MTDRPNCLAQHACQAKTPGKHCRRCTATALNKSPERRAAAAITMRALRQDPDFDAAYRAANDRRNEAIRAHHAKPEVRAAMLKVAKVGLEASRIARTELTYIPEGYRDLYRHLVGKRLMTAAQAKAAVEDQRRTDARRAIREQEVAQRARHARQQAEAY